jgi:adenylate cyclase
MGQPAGKRRCHPGIASRPEGLNKDLDTSILVSTTVLEIAKGSFGLRSIGPITIKGRAGRIEVFELAVARSL